MSLARWGGNPVLVPLVALVAAALIGLVAQSVVFGALDRIARHGKTPLAGAFVEHSRAPAKPVLPLLAADLVAPVVSLTPGLVGALEHAIDLALIACGAWLVVRWIDVLASHVVGRYAAGPTLDVKTRRVRTQCQIIRRVLVVATVIVAGSLMLLTFERVRTVGTSLLASAGLAALVAGIAVRPTVANLLAGLQIALTEPLDLGDAVVVEGEWGWVEEITFTYVVLRTWDLRRLIVPISLLTEKPFQNWSRVSPDVLGTVVLYADYSLSVPAVREELHRILRDSRSWDGKVWALQVTDATEHALELRALMSAPNADAMWELRCEVRERLVDFLQRQYPDCLPKTRAAVTPGRLRQG